jgi:hypothetical protein
MSDAVAKASALAEAHGPGAPDWEGDYRRLYRATETLIDSLAHRSGRSRYDHRVIVSHSFSQERREVVEIERCVCGEGWPCPIKSTVEALNHP